MTVDINKENGRPCVVQARDGGRQVVALDAFWGPPAARQTMRFPVTAEVAWNGTEFVDLTVKQ